MMDLWIVFVLGLATASVSDKLLVSSQVSPVPSSQADDLYLEGHPSGDLPVDDEGDDDDDIVSGSGDFSGDFFHHDVTTLTDPKVLFDIFEVTPARPGATQSSPPNPPTTAAEEDDRRDPLAPTAAEDSSVTSSDVFPEKEEDSEVVPAAGEQPTADWSDAAAATSSPTSASPPPPPPPSETVPSREAGGEGVVLTKEDGGGVQLEGGAGGRMLDLETPEEGVTSESLWERTEVLAAIIACAVVAFLCAICLFLLLAYRMKKKDEGSYDLGVTKVPPTAYQKAPTKEFYA